MPRSRVLRAASSTALGLALLGWICLYLAVVTVLASVRPDALRSAGIPPEGAYAHWLLVLPELALCLNILLACWFRIPLTLDRLGAWAAHGGVLLLAIGAMWYATARREGRAISMRKAHGFSSVEHIYLDSPPAVYAGDEAGLAMHSPVTVARLRDADIEPVLLAAPFEDIRLQAIDYLPRARLADRWTNDAPGANLAAVVELTDPRHGRGRVTLPASRAGMSRIAMPGYVLTFERIATAERFAAATTTRPASEIRPAAQPRMPHHLVRILYHPDTGARIAHTAPDASRASLPFEPGATVRIPLGDRELLLEPLGLLDRAMRVAEAAAVTDETTEASPAVKVQVVVGERSASTWLAMRNHPQLGPPVKIPLPGGRTLRLAFAPTRIPLGQTLHVLDAEFVTQPGSVVPRDYRCTIRVGGRERRTLSLNNPLHLGPWQMTQGSWLPDPREPEVLIFETATRPGLPVIWTGCVLICLGIPYAFYIKPLIRRRRAR